MTGESFEDVAKRLSEPQRPPETDAARESKREKLLVKVEWAQTSLEFCFLPLARLDHPAWALTEEESQKGAPTMQAFLQCVADRIAPAVLARVVNKYPEFMDLLGMLGVLYYQKYRDVQALKRLEDSKGGRRIASVPRTESASPDAESVHCDECGHDFSTREAAFAHLPCPGKNETKN